MFKSKKLVSIFVAVLLVCFGRQVMAVSLVVSGTAKACIIIGEKPSWQDEFAAGELYAYIKKMSGAELPVYRLNQMNKASSMLRILLGSRNTHELINKLSELNEITLDEKYLTQEGFIIKTVKWQDTSYLVIAGAGDSGTVYAAYDFLERFGRVGFFRYEEHVPERSEFSIDLCDIKERPHFRVRMHGGQYCYYGIHWFCEDQWKENLRWYAKSRFNRTNYIPGPAVTSVVERGAWQRLGIEVDISTNDAPDKKLGGAVEMLKAMSKYGIKLGVRAPLPSSDGSIPPELVKQFRHKYPDAKYLTFARNGSTEIYIDPSDPLWLKLNQALLENAMANYGETALCAMPSPWQERSPGDTPQEKERLISDYGKAVGRLANWAQQKYPGTEWMIDGWAFANKEYWQPYRVEHLFNSLPNELDLVIWDYPAEDEPSFVYNSYWYKRAWAFIVCHSMAGNSTVHGDLIKVLGNTQRVLSDQRAGKLVGFGTYNECNDYAPLFKDMILHMAWNPFINMDDFIKDYCERRYSLKSVSTMIICHEKMLKTIYGPQSDTHLTDGFRTVRAMDPIYWFKLGGNWVPFDQLQENMLKLRSHWGPLLRDALADALVAAKYERNNAAYTRDLVDLMRSYVHVRINQAIWDAVQAARSGNMVAFEHHYAHINRLFDYLLKATNAVSDRWEFGVNALIEDFADAPLKYSPEEIRHYLYYVTFGGDKIYDYLRTDRYEMIRDVYRPMTMAYLDTCRTKETKGQAEIAFDNGAKDKTIMDTGAAPLSAQQAVDLKYQVIIDGFIKGPCPPPPSVPNGITVAKEFLDAAKCGDI